MSLVQGFSLMERKRYLVAEDLKPYLFPLTPWGKQAVLPDLEEIIDPSEILQRIYWATANVDYHNAAVKLPGEQYSQYCKLFLHSQPGGGGWDGSGLVLVNRNMSGPRLFHFALCKHTKTEVGHNPNHSRGWHPGHCSKCNMDMTVDSGD